VIAGRFHFPAALDYQFLSRLPLPVQPLPQVLLNQTLQISPRHSGFLFNHCSIP
jgi:hypothetical protein